MTIDSLLNVPPQPSPQPDLLTEVINGGFCIGCGACALVSPSIQIKENHYGLYQAEVADTHLENRIQLDNMFSPSVNEKAAAVCPFAATIDETQLGKERHSERASFDSRVGYYQKIYAGHVVDGSYRSLGSSGGMMTWVLMRLLEMGKIDGVIHVSSTGEQGNLFEYSLSHSVEDITKNAKSRYYPVQMSDVLNRVKHSKKRYALVGVPCFIKAARLLAKQDRQINESLIYYMAIFCGHLKSKAFAEMIAWQRKVSPSHLTYIDFRVKDHAQPANRYKIEVSTGKRQSSVIRQTRVRDLFGMDWGLGYFKPKACDWCDDIVGEGADLACGDAWLPEFVHQSNGNNVAIVRHPELLELLQAAIKNKELKLTDLSVERLVASQAANYRHRHDGLAFRISEANEKGEWHPIKRIKPIASRQEDSVYSTVQYLELSEKRKQLYRQRERLSEQSHEAFYQAKQRSSLGYFYWRMLPLELSYYYGQGRLVKGGLKSLYAFFRFNWHRFLHRK